MQAVLKGKLLPIEYVDLPVNDDNIKKNEVVFVGLITSSYRPKMSGPLFSVPMSTSMSMLPDVLSAENC